MANYRSRKDEPMTECMKIRYYVMNLLYKNPRVSIKLASIRELAAQFGVANSTVALVMNQLKKEKFLIARQGLGNFTNPSSTSIWKYTKPVIGLIWGAGKHYFHDYRAWHILAKVGEELCKDGYSVRYVFLAGNTDEAILNELLNSYLSGFVWFYSHEISNTVFARLKEAGIISVGINMQKKCSTVEFSDKTDLEAGSHAVLELMNKMLQHPEIEEHVFISKYVEEDEVN